MSGAVSLNIQKQSKPFGLMQNIMEIFSIQKVQKREPVKEIVSWRTRYSINIEEIDNQHKEIIGLINNFFDGIFKGISNREACYRLEELIQTSWDHFAFEEDLMLIHKYPGLLPHKRTHDNFINELNTRKYDMETNRGPISLNSGDFIRKWIVNHILSADKSYSMFLRLRENS